MARLGIWFCIFNTCDGVWLNGVGQSRENNKEHDEDYVEQGFQWDSVKRDRHGEGVREDLSMGCCSINI